MKLPGFNAESSLGPSQGTYLAGKTSNGSAPGAEILAARRREQSCTTKYKAYISAYFPVTVCRPIFNDLSNSVATMAKAAPGSPTGSRGLSVLNSPRGQLGKFGALQDCRTVALPFIADVTTTQACDDLIPDTSVLEIWGHPELSTSWNGGIEHLPAPYDQAWFGVAGSSCSCCAPFTQCPDGRCVLHQTSCDQHPA